MNINNSFSTTSRPAESRGGRQPWSKRPPHLEQPSPPVTRRGVIRSPHDKITAIVQIRRPSIWAEIRTFTSAPRQEQPSTHLRQQSRSHRYVAQISQDTVTGFLEVQRSAFLGYSDWLSDAMTSSPLRRHLNRCRTMLPSLRQCYFCILGSCSPERVRRFISVQMG